MGYTIPDSRADVVVITAYSTQYSVSTPAVSIGARNTQCCGFETQLYRIGNIQWFTGNTFSVRSSARAENERGMLI